MVPKGSLTDHQGKIGDKSLAVVEARAEVHLPLDEFHPRSTLVHAEHKVRG